ncbi:MAG: IS110 family transposase [Nitrospinota bacterium]
MERIALYVGLDYHQGSVQVCVMDEEGRVVANRKCVNHWRAISRAVARHGEQVHAALEACAGAAELAEELTGRAGWSVALAHPGYVARMRQSPDKTDFSDARMLADLVRVGYLPRVWLPPREVRELRRLVRYRQQLVGEGRAAKLRLLAVLREQRVSSAPGLRRWGRPWLRWLGEGAPLSAQGRWVVQRHLARLGALGAERRLVEERLGSLTAGDPVVEKLLRLPGVGPVTAWTLRAEVGRFERFRSGKQLSRFCGLSPRNASSGARQADSGLIRAGNPQLRGVLIEAAHRLIRWEPRWRCLALTLRAAGKPGSVVAAAVANRWMRWLYHQMQNAA